MDTVRPEEVLEARSVIVQAASDLADILLRSTPALGRDDVEFIAEFELDLAVADICMHVRGIPGLREALDQ